MALFFWNLYIILECEEKRASGNSVYVGIFFIVVSFERKISIQSFIICDSTRRFDISIHPLIRSRWYWVFCRMTNDNASWTKCNLYFPIYTRSIYYRTIFIPGLGVQFCFASSCDWFRIEFFRPSMCFVFVWALCMRNIRREDTYYWIES